MNSNQIQACTKRTHPTHTHPAKTHAPNIRREEDAHTMPGSQRWTFQGCAAHRDLQQGSGLIHD
jgi:hypothetical protein